MTIEEIIANYDKAKADVKKYNDLIKELQQEFVDKYVIGKSFIDKHWLNSFGSEEKRFYYKVTNVVFLERNFFDFDLYCERIYRCTRKEEEITEHISNYHYFISDQAYGERICIKSKNIYEFFFDNTLLEEVTNEELLKRLKEMTGVENIEQLPKLNEYKYK